MREQVDAIFSVLRTGCLWRFVPNDLPPKGTVQRYFDDGRGASMVFAQRQGQPLNRVGRVFADSKYHNHALYNLVSQNARWELVVVRRPERG